MLPVRSRPGTLAVILLALAASACSGVDSSELSGADEDTVFGPERRERPKTRETPAKSPARSGDPTVGSTLVTTADLNLRAGAGTTFDILVTIPSGSAVTVVKAGLENGFMSVKYASQTGWASAQYLVEARAAAPETDDGPMGSEEAPETTSPPAPPPATGGTTKVTIGGPAVRAHVQTFADTACSQVGCPYTVGTYNGHQPTAELAIDMMMAPGGTRPKDGGVHGGKVAEFGIANAKAHRVEYVIWYQRINSNDGRGWRTMADRGSITQNHYDHVHVSFAP